MSQSIKRGGHWWHSRPDGVWLRWSAESGAWEPQAGEPPPPDAPSEDGFEPQADGPAGGPAPASTPAPTPVSTPGQVPTAPSLEVLHTHPKANAPLFSEPRRDLASIYSNKFVQAVLAIAAVVASFTGTYFGAHAVFDGTYGARASAHTQATPPTGFSTAKWNFILEVDEICADTDAFARELQESVQGVDSPEELDAVIDDLNSEIAAVNTEIAQLPKPKQDRRLLNRILSINQRVPEFLERISGAVKAFDLAELQQIAAEANTLGAKQSALMQKYGFQVCGRIAGSGAV
ncbi:MAG: hypothetical protein M3280_13860 [Actinomycetota bacterium]|nr:hypothetical protein [Actinomycetota bacterium]